MALVIAFNIDQYQGSAKGLALQNNRLIPDE